MCGLKSGRIHVIDSALGEIVKKMEGHAASVNAWYTEDDRVWSCGGDGKVKCWDLSTGNCIAYILLGESDGDADDLQDCVPGM